MSGARSTSTRIGLVAFAVFSASCASVPNDVTVSFDPATSVSYDRLDHPPRISTLTYSELVAAGHLYLGTAAVSRVVEECWDRSGHCYTGRYSVGLTTALLVEAMNLGADTVVFATEREETYKDIERRGRCLKTDRICVKPKGRVQCSSGEYGDQVFRCASHCQIACTIFEVVKGTAQIETSRASLWRRLSP